VGPEGREEPFTIHRDLICSTSKFFKAACSKLWAEGKEKVVRLPEIDVDIFQAYVVWVYHGKVAVNKLDTNGGKATAHDEMRETVGLYLLGDVIDDILLRNAAMRVLVTQSKVWMCQAQTDLLNHIWESTPPKSLLRKMIVDKTIMRLDRGSMTDDTMADYPKDMLHCIARALMMKSTHVTYDVFASGLDGYLEPETSNDPEKPK